MKRTFIYAIVGAVGVTGIAETTPKAFAAETKGATSLEQVRAKVRSEAMTSLAAGNVENVGHRRWHRRHYGSRRYYGGRRYYGRRSWGPRYGYYGRRHWAPRYRYYGRRHWGPRYGYYGRRYYRSGYYGNPYRYGGYGGYGYGRGSGIYIGLGF